MKVHQIVSASLLAAAVAVAIHAQGSQSEAQSFAEEVLQMKDARQFSEMYRQKFHTSMKQVFSEPQWIAAATQVADQTGDNKGRSLGTSDQSNGVYRFRYNSTYENGRAFDDVYIARQGSSWKVVGIWVRPAQ
jgi:hypothetical protein